MSLSMVTVVAPLARDRVLAARAAIDQLGNPATDALRTDIAPAGEAAFLHFASFHAFASSDGESAFLVLEFSADGDERDAIRLLARRWKAALEPIFAMADDWRDAADLGNYLLGRSVKVGHGLFDEVGLAFCGTPGLTVTDIHRQQALSRKLSALLAEQPAGLSPLGRLQSARTAIAADADLKWALTPVPAPKTPRASTRLANLTSMFWPLLKTFAWPILIPLTLLAVWLLWPANWFWGATWPEGLFSWIRHFTDVLRFALGVVLIVTAVLATIVAIGYLKFRKLEDTDWTSDRAPDFDELTQIYARENHLTHAQNHMVSHTVLKPGFLRYLTIRLAYFIIGHQTARNPKPGHLGEIGTIHFARWVALPGTKDLIFFSNFGGSWESYLEDFITKAHAGLTAVWSNTIGYPRTKNLFQDGATDGERFKRYARQSMIHTPFWYCAYPELTTANIRNNAAIRQEFAAARSEDDAVRWLARFGSSRRPNDKLETTQIQSLVFGGLGFKRDGVIVTVRLSDVPVQNAQWLAELLPSVAFNDGRYLREDAVLTFAATASGLAKLGVPDEGIATFPAAFVSGMCGPGRDRILGDTGRNAPENWSWGIAPIDVSLLVYGDDAKAVGRLKKQVETTCARFGAAIVNELPLTPVDPDANKRIEPFGFVDGVSQPVIRGTYRGLRNADPIHLVEPGEFVLGYPDNRGNFPPGPQLSAQHDPELKLPVGGPEHGYAECVAENPRMIGHNGSFLVIRQLEQDTGAFETYCKTEGQKLRPFVANLPVALDDEALSDLVGAKLIGRWKDGSSLVRFPYMSASELKRRTGKATAEETARPKANPKDHDATPIDAANPPAKVSGSRTVGSTTRPDNDFLFGSEDPQGLRCPFGAHVRRANPRDSFEPGSEEQLSIVNRHRIIRVGRGYEDKASKTSGLMFMCLAGDIERQFEFIQQTWMGSNKFHGLDVESDPIVTDGTTGRCAFTVPTRAGPVALSAMPQFVTMRGGGYFFVPGRQLLNWLAARA